MHYIFIALLLIIFELLYFKIAQKYNIIDKPNSRSSHSLATIRGGGIIFPIALLGAYALGYVSGLLSFGVVLVAIVSFIDDITPLNQIPRFGSQIIAFLLVAYDLNLFQEPIWILVTVIVLFIGWINAFNFMDGINGMMVFYSLTAILSLSFIPVHEKSLSLFITVGISGLVFGFFNVRKTAKTFAGDVGSISLALFLGYFMIKTIAETAQFGYILFFSLYGIDSVITIFVRLKKKENIFHAHRTHLYQYLVNEHKYSHVLIASIYAVIQLFINGIIIILDQKGYLNYLTTLGIFLTTITIYLLIRAKVVKRAELKS